MHTDNTLCGVSYGASSPGSSPHLTLYSYNATSGQCATPNVLMTMGQWVLANGAALIPEQKNCDLLCQAKLAAYAPNNLTCANGTPYNNQTCTAVVNAISDKIVANLRNLTNNNASLSIIQTFELPVALYISNTYNQSLYNQQVVFLYEYHGQGVQTNQADYYLGYYAAGTTNISFSNGTTIQNPNMGSANCSWCVNGTSAGGWYDVLKAGAAGVEYAAPSTADLVRPQGGLMVASDWAKWVVGNYSNMGFIGWTLERSTAVFGSSPPAPGAWAVSGYSVFDSVGWAYQQHSGQSSLDYEDQLFMLYALRYDVPNFYGVFSDYPATATAFFNCVPRFEAKMPVSTNTTWANSSVPYTSVTRAATNDSVPLWQQAGYLNETLVLDGSHVWRMFSGGGGLCGVALQDENFYDYDTVPPSLVNWGSNISYTAPNFMYNFTTYAPNKPFPPTLTTSPQDCAYRAKLMTWIKNNLASCAPNKILAPSNFSISHRGSPITYPEHSFEGYRAAVGYGANWIECDTAVTKDFQPVCRHSQCDLHTTTNVLFNSTLAAKCTVPFQPAVLNATTGAVITPANVLCCTYDFTLAEYNSLCAIQDIGAGWSAAQSVTDYFSVGAPAFRSTAFDSYYGGGSNCSAKPATLYGMGQILTQAGRNLIPEQKVCDVLCQAKLVLANPNFSKYNCTIGVYCQPLINAWSDVIVATLNNLTSNNNNATTPNAPYATAGTSGWVLQTFELSTALYVTNAYPSTSIVCFLYQLNGASLSTSQADPYWGYYPLLPASGAVPAGGIAWNVSFNGSTTAFGRQCTWCVNGTSAGGWPDVSTAAAAGVEVGGVSIADLVVPQGALMVASTQAKAVNALYPSFLWSPWTMERSSSTYGTVVSPSWPAGAFGNPNQFMNSAGGYYLNHQGASALDYEDMLFMLCVS
jgi:hypothetical protein